MGDWGWKLKGLARVSELCHEADQLAREGLWPVAMARIAEAGRLMVEASREAARRAEEHKRIVAEGRWQGPSGHTEKSAAAARVARGERAILNGRR